MRGKTGTILGVLLAVVGAVLRAAEGGDALPASATPAAPAALSATMRPLAAAMPTVEATVQPLSTSMNAFQGQVAGPQGRTLPFAAQPLSFTAAGAPFVGSMAPMAASPTTAATPFLAQRAASPAAAQAAGAGDASAAVTPLASALLSLLGDAGGPGAISVTAGVTPTAGAVTPTGSAVTPTLAAGTGVTVTGVSAVTRTAMSPPPARVTMAGSPGPPPRLFLSSTLALMASYGASPLHLGYDDLLWLAPSGVALGVTLHNDLPLYHALATGDARKPWLDHSMPAISSLGDGLMEAGLVAVAAKWGPDGVAQTSAVALQALALAGVYSEALKYAAWSNRPYEDDSGHYFWDFKQPTQGMPSGHTFSAFAVAEVYGEAYGRWWTYPLACVVAYSRVYNQDHWPSDVLAGALLGIAAGVQADRAAEAGGAPLLRFSVEPSNGSPMVVAHAHF